MTNDPDVESRLQKLENIVMEQQKAMLQYKSIIEKMYIDLEKLKEKELFR